MNLPTSVVITGCESMQDLDQAITAARTFAPMSEAQAQARLKKTAPLRRTENMNCSRLVWSTIVRPSI